jgi:hypothetical protein
LFQPPLLELLDELPQPLEPLTGVAPAVDVPHVDPPLPQVSLPQDDPQLPLPFDDDVGQPDVDEPDDHTFDDPPNTPRD